MHSLKRVEEKVTTLCSSLDDFRVAQELPSFNPIQIEPYKNSIREFLLFDGLGDLSKYFAFTSCPPKGEFEPKYKVQEFIKSGNDECRFYSSARGVSPTIAIEKVVDALIVVLDFKDDDEGTARRALINNWYEDYEEEEGFAVPLTIQQKQDFFEKLGLV